MPQASLRSIDVSTKYPRGYGDGAPRLVTGEVSVRYGTSSYQYEDHTLTADALEQIADIALADYLKAQETKPEIPGVLLFSEAQLPPLPEPEAPAVEADLDADRAVL